MQHRSQRLQYTFTWLDLQPQSHISPCMSVHLLGVVPSVLPGVLPLALLVAPVPALLSLPPGALLVSPLPVSLRHRESWGYLKWIKYISREYVFL